jgi:TonB family protein
VSPSEHPSTGQGAPSRGPDPIFNRRRDRTYWRIAFAALLTLLVHVGAVGVVALFSLLGWLAGAPKSPFKQPEAVSLMNLPAAQWEQNRKEQNTPRSAQVTPPEQKKPEEKKQPLPKGQVVDVQPGNDQKPPDDAKYLAEHDNKVAKESRAKQQSAFYKNAMPHRTTTVPPSQTQGQDNVTKPQVAGNQGLANDSVPAKPGQQAGHFDVPSAEKRDKVALLDRGQNPDVQNHGASDGVKGNSNHLDISPGPMGQQGESQSQGKKGDQNVANLMPSAATLDKIAGAAANDHLDDVDEGDSTFLNTREFKYATFFNRVKQSVGEHWDPSTPLRSRDPEGKIYAYKDRSTLLTVTLDTTGRLVRVSVSKSCGVDFLDDEAVAAFERAQPFPNPPPGLVDNGLVRFNFGFFLEVNSGSNLRIFRSRD